MGEGDGGFQIFICYRRDDSAGHAGRLADHLQQRFGGESVFMDVETLEPGLDFLEAIELSIQRCDVFLPMIGRSWSSLAGSDGKRRIDNEDDPVRLEVEAALNRTDLRIIPLLVQGATMPKRAELPQSMSRLATRVAHELSDGRWKYDVEQLVSLLEKIGAPPISPPSTKRGKSTGRRRRNLAWGDYAHETNHSAEKIAAAKILADQIEQLAAWVPSRSTNQVIYRSSGEVALSIQFWGDQIRLFIPNVSARPDPDPLPAFPGSLDKNGGWAWFLPVRRGTRPDLQRLVDFANSLVSDQA